VGREVLLPVGPSGDRVDDAADELLDAALAFRRADLAAEILRDDDVGRLLRPGFRDLDVALLEDDFPFFRADDGRAKVPLDFVERVDAFRGEEALVVEAGDRRPAYGGGVRGGGPSLLGPLFRTCHCSSLRPMVADTRAPRVGPDAKLVLGTNRQTGDCRGWETPVPSVGWRDNMDLVYPAVKALIHYILCLFGSSSATYGGIDSLAEGSFTRPILESDLDGRAIGRPALWRGSPLSRRRLAQTPR